MVKQAPKCKIGFPCGKSCISRTKNCYANLSTKDNKVVETFSQFVNRLVGIGNNTQSELNIPEETKIEITKNPREELLNNVINKEINSIIKSAKEEYPIDSQDVKKIAGSFKKGNKLNKGLAAVIQNYTFEGYVDINDYLRGKKLTKNVFDPNVKKLVSKELTDEDPETKEIAAKIKAMDLAYDELNDLKEDTKVYRGLGINFPGELSNIINLKPGDTFEDPAFVSTSPDRLTAENFSDGDEGGILLEINLNKGFKNAKDISDINEFGENEILINRGTKFKVESVEEITIGNGETRKLIKLSPIDDNNNTNKPFDINQELKDENYIGGGEFGKVYKSNDSDIVIKEGNLGEDEIRIPQKLKSLGFNNAIEIIEHKENRVAMKLVKGKPINELNDTEVNNLAPKIKEAVKKMGELGVSHNDIHNRNILYNEETDSIVIIDFGLAEDNETLFLDNETLFLDAPNTPGNLRRNIIKDGYKTLRDILKDIPKLNNLIDYFNSQYGQNIKDIEYLLRYMNTNKFEKIMEDEDKFNELFQFIYN